MGTLDGLKYEAKLYALENGRYNYYVTVATGMGQGWSQSIGVGHGSADSEHDALDQAQTVATEDRKKRAEERAAMKTVALK